MQGALVWVVVVSLLVANLFVFAAAQTACVPFRGSPATNHRCDVFLNGHNILLLGKTYEETDAAAATYANFFGAFVPTECRAVALQLLCLVSFPVCEPGPPPSVTLPCRSVCEEMWLQCLSTVQAFNATSLMPDCDSLTVSNGVAYPAFLPDTAVPACIPYTGAAEVAYSEADCPYPLTYTPKDNPADSCVLQCPAYLFGGEAEYWGSVAAMYITTVPSMVLSLVMIITWLLNPSKRRYPAVLILWLAVSAFAVSLSMNLSVLVGGPKRTTCTWDANPIAIDMENAHENNGQGVVCIIQAIGSYYFGLTCNTWWLAITVNIFLMLCFHKHDWVRRWSRFIHYSFHVFCWGVPLAGLIAMLSMKRLGASGIAPWCQIQYSPDESWIDWVFYTAPILFCIVVGTILMIISITRFIIVQLRYERSRASELVNLLRLVLLVVFVWLNNVFYLAYRVHTETKFDSVTDSVSLQAICSLLTGTDCPFDIGLNYPFFIVSIIASLATGACVFLTMCTTKSTLVLWVQLACALRHPRSFMAQAKMVISGQASSSSADHTPSLEGDPSGKGLSSMSRLTPPTSTSSSAMDYQGAL